jgi:hypothetical protein
MPDVTVERPSAPRHSMVLVCGGREAAAWSEVKRTDIGHQPERLPHRYAESYSPRIGSPTADCTPRRDLRGNQEVHLRKRWARDGGGIHNVRAEERARVERWLETRDVES